MNSRRELVHQILATGGSVLLFVAAAVAISLTFNRSETLSETGGLAIVAAMAGFILLLAVAGLWINSNDYED